MRLPPGRGERAEGGVRRAGNASAAPGEDLGDPDPGGRLRPQGLVPLFEHECPDLLFVAEPGVPAAEDVITRLLGGRRVLSLLRLLGRQPGRLPDPVEAFVPPRAPRHAVALPEAPLRDRGPSP